MSLLNDVMRDLQTRGVLGMPPLAGLQPVADVPGPHQKRHLLFPVLAAITIVAIIVVWRPISDGVWLQSIAGITSVEPSQPKTEALSVDTPPIIVRPPVGATGKDLRELFSIETAASESRIAKAELPPLQAHSINPANVDKARLAGTADVVDLPPIESQPVAAFPAATAAPEYEPALADSGSARTTILRREPGVDDIDGIVMRAQRAMRSRDFSSAERLFREALAIKSRDVTLWTYLYSVLVSAGRTASAEQALQQGLNSAHEPAALAKLYARVLVNRGDKSGAVTVLQNARPAPVSDTEYDAFLAAVLQQTGGYAGAGEVYRQLLAVDPDSGPWLIGLAMANDSLGNGSEALAGFQRALESGSLKSPLDRYARRRIAELQAYE